MSALRRGHCGAALSLSTAVTGSGGAAAVTAGGLGGSDTTGTSSLGSVSNNTGVTRGRNKGLLGGAEIASGGGVGAGAGAAAGVALVSVFRLEELWLLAELPTLSLRSGSSHWNFTKVLLAA